MSEHEINNSVNKQALLERAIKITEEYARGGGADVANMLDQVYHKLVELKTETLK